MSTTAHRLLRYALIGTGVCLVLLVTTTVAIGATVATAVAKDGLITVEVEEKVPGGTHVSGSVPATLVRLGVGVGLGVAHRFDPQLESELSAAREQAEPWLPATREILSALEDAPSTPLVEVTTDDTRVRVSKEGRRLVIEVDDPEFRVFVSTPVHLAGAVLDSVFG